MGDAGARLHITPEVEILAPLMSAVGQSPTSVAKSVCLLSASLRRQRWEQKRIGRCEGTTSGWRNPRFEVRQGRERSGILPEDWWGGRGGRR